MFGSSLPWASASPRYTTVENDNSDWGDEKSMVFGSSKPSRRAFSSSDLLLLLCGLLVGASSVLPIALWRSNIPLAGLCASSSPGVPLQVTNGIRSAAWSIDERFALERNENASRTAWEKSGSKFVLVDSPAEKRLQPSWPEGANRQIYSVASYHQLHCTSVIHFAWHQLLDHGEAVLQNEFPGIQGEYTIGGHFSHCVEIIRQALECYADPTLESQLEINGTTISDIGLASGWGTTRTCRDFNALTRWVEENEAVYEP